MNLSEIIQQKKKTNTKIKTELGLLKKHKSIGLIKIKNTKVLSNLLEGLKTLPSDFIILSDEKIENLPKNICVTNTLITEDLRGIDFVVCDTECDQLKTLLGDGIVPIVSSEIYMNSFLEEYKPLKAEGNSYLYGEQNSWSIFYSIIRYLENFKFPYDNKNLVKNVLATL